jgi:signal transduction histidine kinase
VSRLAPRDRWLLFTLLPIFAVCFALHLRQVVLEGLPQPPIFAVPVWGHWGEGYPVVGGLRFERGHDWSGLEPGDRLLRAGQVDLRGAGYLSTEAILLEQAGRRGVVSVLFERDGVRRTTPLRIQRYDAAWTRVPFALSWAVIAVLVLLRAPGSPRSRLLFAAFLTFAIVETPFRGSSRWLTYLDDVTFHGLGPVALCLLTRLIIAFPEEMDERYRLSPWWSALGLLFTATRVGYYLGGPWPPQWAPYVVLGADVAIAALGTFALTWNYAHAAPIGRRRIKWLILSGYAGVLPVLAIGLTAALGGRAGGIELHRVFQYSQVLAALFPVGCLVAVLRYNLFDIDRLLTATTTTAVLFAAGGLAALVVVPQLATALAGGSPAQERVTELLLLVGLAAVVVPVVRFAAPRLSHAFSRPAHARELAFDQLLRDLAACRTRSEVLSLLETRFRALLEPESCALFAAGEGGFRPISPAGDATEGLPWPGSALPPVLERDPAPLVLEEEDLPELDPEDRRALRDRDARLVVPVRSGKDLAAFAVLGPKRSGDVYTPAELRLLEGAGRRASDELRRLRDAATIARERARAAELTALKEEAEQANLAKSRFLEAASGELRRPLRQLEGSVERLVERAREDRALAAALQIQSSTRALAEMFDPLLDLSVLEAGAQKAHVRDFELQPLLARLAAQLEPQATAKGLSIRRELAAARVRSDPTLLARIVQNLLGNAIRYTERGHVALRSQRHRSGGWLIEVADTGPGISAQRQREIFREFVQLEGDEGKGGLGLGLSIVDHLARLLGHHVEVESASGRGAVFRVFVAAAAGDERLRRGGAGARA